MADENQVDLQIGQDELVIRKRYQALSIANDIVMALWFLAGSILSFWDQTARAATWLFLLGSVQFLVRPVIRLARLIHIRRIGGSGLDSPGDY
jgi:hypothetical protein